MQVFQTQKDEGEGKYNHQQKVTLYSEPKRKKMMEIHG
jgi:hypothetical protein